LNNTPILVGRSTKRKDYKMKKTLLVSLAIIICFTFFGCTSLSEVSDEEHATSDEFVTMVEIHDEAVNLHIFTYYRNILTDVVYIATYYSDGGGLVEMTDPETNQPLTYDKFCELYEAKRGPIK